MNILLMGIGAVFFGCGLLHRNEKHVSVQTSDAITVPNDEPNQPENSNIHRNRGGSRCTDNAPTQETSVTADVDEPQREPDT